MRRAREARLVETHLHDLREFTEDRHRSVDDRPFGGGEGMVMKPEPIFDAVESLNNGIGTAIVLLSASGRLFQQKEARELAQLDQVVLICGRYEGVDERVAEHLATHEISIGDFVLSGGELAAAMIIDAVTRLLPGALGNADSVRNESFSPGARDRAPVGPPIASRAQQNEAHGILDYPHYTRPPSFRGWGVPEVLMSGNHEEIRRWRLAKALEKTRRNRPDLLAKATGALADSSELEAGKERGN